MQYRPLADEIRPQTLEDVVGQSHILGKNGVVAPHHRERSGAQHGLLRPLRHRQDHSGQHHRQADPPHPAPAQRHHRLHCGHSRRSSLMLAPCWRPTGCCSTWMRSSISIKSSSSPCWSSWRTARSPSSPPPRRTPTSTVFNAVLSRSTVFEFKPVTPPGGSTGGRPGLPAVGGAQRRDQPGIEDGVREHMATACGGDVRKAINAVELLLLPLASRWTAW